MRLVLFTTVLRGEAQRSAHDEMVANQRQIADETPGFVAWHEVATDDPLTTTGALVFETDEALAAWRDHPDHLAVHQRGEDEVYASFDVQIYALERRNTWARPAG